MNYSADRLYSSGAYANKPGKWRAALYAGLVHILFFGLLILGVSWKSEQTSPVAVDIWNNLPPIPSKPKPIVEKPPEPEPPKVVEKEEPKIEKRPEVKPKSEPKVKTKQLEAEKERQADILLKNKHEQERRKQEKLEQEKIKQEKLKQEKLDQEKSQKKEQQRQLDALRQQQQMQEQQEIAKLRQAQLASVNRKLVNDYKSRIQSKIRRFLNLPPDLAGNPQAEVEVILLPTGEVSKVRIIRSSGIPAYDNAVERAVYRAQPLPLPPDAALFNEFRELHLKFRLNEDT